LRNPAGSAAMRGHAAGQIVESCIVCQVSMSPGSGFRQDTSTDEYR
jgi:hypothetical protein